MKIKTIQAGVSDEDFDSMSLTDKTGALHRRSFLKAAGLLGGSTLLGQFAWSSPQKGQPVLNANSFGASSVQEVITKDVFKPLDVRNVKVGGEIGRRIDITANNNLLKLDADNDFILPFRQKKLEGKGYSDYVGLGKLIDATVRFAAYTNSENVLSLKKHIVDEIIKAQEADGYIGIMVKESRMWRLWDIHEMGYIVMGLASDYHYFREKRSLIAAQKLADYMLERWATMPVTWEKFGAIGLESNLLALYRETGEKRYLNFCVRQRAIADWNLTVAKGLDPTLIGHIYTDLDLCLAQCDLFRIQPASQLLKPSRQAIDFMTKGDGMTITGAAGLWESWNDAQEARGNTAETCSTAYQIRIFDTFLRMEGNAQHGDILERIIYNALFAAQSPDGRKLRYFTSLEGNRVYFDKDTYCCPNNFRRIIAELPTFIFYKSSTGVAVNLYTTSEATIALNDNLSVKIRQETQYPSNGKVMIYLDPSKPVRFPLQLRIPRWCDKAVVSVNGKQWEKPIVSGEFLALEREWNTGDQVTLEMAMPFRFVLGRKRQSGRVAVMRGPVVFCLDPAQKDALQKKDAADLTGYMIDSKSINLISDDATVRPNGVACTIDANEWTFSLGNRDNNLKLTELPNPDGKVVYFRISDSSEAVNDEILS